MNRAWTYIISKKLSETDLNNLLAAGKSFVTSWTAHDRQLSAEFDIFNERIIIVKVNEAATAASGCSIDKLTKFIKDIEAKFGIELLNRFLVAYNDGDELQITHASLIKELLADRRITPQSIFYNTAVLTENELKNWEQPLKNTWLNKYLEKI
jgi:hypothetical protein